MRPSLLLLATLMATLTASAQVPSYVPTNGLIAWYPLDGNAIDLGENAFNGTESGTMGAVSREGTTDGALEFNGSSHVNLGNSSVLNPAEMSVSCWFQIQSWNTQSGLSTILGRNLNSGSHRYGFNMGIFGPNNTAIGQTGLRFGFDDDSNSGEFGADYNIPEPLNLNEWYHFGITMNLQEEELIFYLNGTVVATENIPSVGVNPINADVLMGFYRPNGNHSLTGLLDDIGIWDRTLSNLEMTGIYSETPPVLGCTDASACNYDAEANADDGSCEYGCLYCGSGTIWDPLLETCVAAPPELDTSGNCTLFNLQELAEGYQILLAENTQLDSLLADCNGMSTSDQSGPCAGENVVTYHGYDYDIVEIGDQCWFAENLRNTSYSDGTTITHVPSTSDWANQTSGARVAYDNDALNADTFGLLYNWFAVNDTRGICPAGWSVPSDSEWLELDALAGIPPGELNGTGNRGAGSGAGTKWKASSPDWNGTDDLGFKAIPGGVEHEHGGFAYLLQEAYWWTASEGNATDAWRRAVKSTDIIDRRIFDKRAGMSVRCVKD